MTGEGSGAKLKEKSGFGETPCRPVTVIGWCWIVTEKKEYRVSNGLHVMGILLLVVIFCMCLYLSSFAWDDLKLFLKGALAPEEYGTLEAIALLDTLAIVEFYLLLSRYEVFGKITLDEEYIVLSAPFRRRITLRLEEIAFVGIDYGTYSGSRHFWIFFSKERVPQQCIHHINLLKISESTIKLQYDPKLCDFLVRELPSKLSKQLQASTSVIRLFASKKHKGREHW